MPSYHAPISIIVAILLSACSDTTADRSPSSAHTVVLQRQRNTCGLAALAMILQDRGVNVSSDSLEKILPVNGDGVSMSAIAKAATAMGVPMIGVRCTLSRLDSLGIPAILWVDKDHYVVADSVTRDTVFLRDPARGLVQQPSALFLRRWSGEALVPARGKTS